MMETGLIKIQVIRDIMTFTLTLTGVSEELSAFILRVYVIWFMLTAC